MIIKDTSMDETVVLAETLNRCLSGRTIVSVDAGHTAGWVVLRFTDGSYLTVWVGKDAAPVYLEEDGQHQHNLALFCGCGRHGNNFPSVDALEYLDDEELVITPVGGEATTNTLKK